MANPVSQSHASDNVAVTPLDRWLGPVMFAVTCAFLSLVGLAIHLVTEESERYLDIVSLCGWGLLVLWPIFLLEVLIHRWSGGRISRLHLWACLFPPLRFVTRDHQSNRSIWLPGFGWQVTDDQLAERIELNLGYPMIGVALLILPLLATEQFAATAIDGNAQLGLAVQVSGALIWQAFAMEFLIMIGLVSKKLKFVKSHWLDVAIICLPVIAFLRVARLGRVLRLHQLGKLTKTAKMFRLRGLAMRAWRAVLILEIIDRVLHRDPRKRLAKLEEELATREAELAELREQIETLRSALAAEAPAPAEGLMPDIPTGE